MMGKPCARGTGIPVSLLREKPRAGETPEENLVAHRQLTSGRIAAAAAISLDRNAI